MRTNSNIKIQGEKVVLVPYRKMHVPKYHEWMKSPELQRLTASEPLSIDEEYQMQNSWLEDEDKCTFIILDKLVLDATNNETAAMIGDTNLFFINNDELLSRVAEAEIMIAEPEARGKRCGWEAMLLMLRYGAEDLGVQKYQVKIALDNTRSISMFKKIGFTEISSSEVFQETTMELPVSSTWKEWLLSQTSRATVSSHD